MFFFYCFHTIFIYGHLYVNQIDMFETQFSLSLRSPHIIQTTQFQICEDHRAHIIYKI
jgi:hypothetical protein